MIGARVTASIPGRPPLRALLPRGADALAVGALAATLVVVAAVRYGATAPLAVGAVLCPTVVLLAGIDLRHRLLPNAIVLPAAVLVGLVVALVEPGRFVEHLWSGLALFGFLFLFAAIFADGLGMGDAKLGLLIGLALGTATATAMFYALFAVFIAAGVILVRHGAGARRRTIAFGPFLAFGAAVAFFLG